MKQAVTFGQIVRERRGSQGLTQSELARRAGCAPITVRKIEADDLRPSVQLAELLAQALSVPDTEQLAFVQLARQETDPSPLPAPTPAPLEIGQADLSGRAVKGFQFAERIGSGGFYEWRRLGRNTAVHFQPNVTARLRRNVAGVA